MIAAHHPTFAVATEAGEDANALVVARAGALHTGEVLVLFQERLAELFAEAGVATGIPTAILYEGQGADVPPEREADAEAARTGFESKACSPDGALGALR